MAYAKNYTYVISDYKQDTVLRAYGPVSPAFGAYFEPTIPTVAPYMNYSIARQTIIDGLGGDARIVGLTNEEFGANPTNDANWEAANLVSFNYTGNADNQFRADMLPMCQLWFGRIGMTVTDGLTFWSYFLKLLHGFTPGGFDDLLLYWVGWGPDYLSPMNQIQPLFSNTSESNSASINDPYLESMFVLWAAATDIPTRVEIVHNMSLYINSQYTHVWSYHPKVQNIHAADLYDVPYNARGNFWAYPIKRNETWTPF
jgi:hypothetical protein